MNQEDKKQSTLERKVARFASTCAAVLENHGAKKCQLEEFGLGTVLSEFSTMGVVGVDGHPRFCVTGIDKNGNRSSIFYTRNDLNYHIKQCSLALKHMESFDRDEEAQKRFQKRDFRFANYTKR